MPARPPTGPTSLGFTDVFTRATPQDLDGRNRSRPRDAAPRLSHQRQHERGCQVQRLRAVLRRVRAGRFPHHAQTDSEFRLRFEHESGIREANNKLIVGFDSTAANPLQQNVSGLQIPGQVEYAGVNGNPVETGNALAVKPAPRIGFAYSPTARRWSAADTASTGRRGSSVFRTPSGIRRPRPS
jgi:hypothetical protein